MAFDLYRGHLLDALGCSVADDGEDERAHWERLGLFRPRGILPHHVATPDHPAPAPAPEPEEATPGFAPSLSHLAAAVLATAGIAGAFTGGG
ncbi:hypothetical protein [Streptomyces virginiae]|uniref:hypothetical protein n=1 Tax=Streptomyces virginiae TaxID=1961 RepID=UPI0036F6D28C